MQQTGLNTSSFLPHIAGLRAIAIILVVLFHLDGSAWAHGYLGVDIFLVISGYMLFRSRLRKSAPDGLRDSAAFLYKRFMRIVPPMAIIILLTMAVGMLLMGCEDLNFLCGLGGYSLLGAANFSLRWSFEDYFAQDSAFIPLLHIWYLAVILQVYMLWAIGNYLIQRLPKGVIVAVLIVLGLASLAYCYSFPIHEWLKEQGIAWWEQDKAPSYYQTLPRVWEILAGGLICILPSTRRRALSAFWALLGLLGILILSLGKSILGGGIDWIDGLPCVLLVVLCTVLLIRYLPESGLNAILANKALVWVGKISFSIYLVHMPIIFFWKLWQFGQIGPWDMLGSFLLSIPLGYAFWWSIENRRFTWWLAALLWLAAMGTCHYGKKTAGFEWVMQDSMPIKPSYNRWKLNTDPELEVGLSKEIVPSRMVFKLMNIPKPLHESITTPLMLMGDYDQKPTIVLMGDSYGSHLYPGFDYILKKEKLAGIYYSPMVIPLHYCKLKTYKQGHIDLEYYISPETEDFLMNWLAAHPELKHIVIGQYWNGRIRQHSEIGATKDFTNDLRLFLQRMKEMGKNVILFAPTPKFKGKLYHYYKIVGIRNKTWDVIPSKCTYEDYINKNTVSLSVIHKMQTEGLCSVVFPLDTLAPGDSFESQKNGISNFDDTFHITPSFSKWLVEHLWSSICDALKK